MSHLVIICPLVMPVADPPGKRLQLRCVAALADFSASRSSSSASLSSPSGVWMEIPAAARVVRKRFTMDMRAIFFVRALSQLVHRYCKRAGSSRRGTSRSDTYILTPVATWGRA